MSARKHDRRMLWLLTSGLLAAVSCSQSPGTDRPASAGQPRAAHAVHSDALRKVMRSLQSRTAEDWPQEIAQHRQAEDRRAGFTRLAETAGVLAAAARRIPASVPDSQLSPEDRKVFDAQAAGLAEAARALHAAAEARDAPAANQALARIKAGCLACHERFADLAGPPSFGW